ncbi:MAG TPA: IclR family transcriptional regulator C-terminal domain-containing protein [Nocardioidaceae bacterium]
MSVSARRADGDETVATVDAGEPGGRTDHFVQSLARGLDVITAFGSDRQEMTLSEVAKATGMTRATARRFLLTLVDLGYMRSEGRLFRLTPRVLDLGYSYLSSLSLPGIAGPHLERLAGETHESSSMSVLDGADIVYVARVPTSRIMTVSINVGTRFPAYATSMGRVLLSGLDEESLASYLDSVRMEQLTERTVHEAAELRRVLDQVRKQGYALVDGELELGLRALAVPVHDRAGRVVAAVNVSSHVSRLTVERARREFLPPLRRAAAAIEADLLSM